MDLGGSGHDSVAWEDEKLQEIKFSGESRLGTQVQKFGTGRSGQREQMAVSCASGNSGQAWERTLRKQSFWSPCLGTVSYTGTRHYSLINQTQQPYPVALRDNGCGGLQVPLHGSGGESWLPFV